jgi:hypothetical protein
MSIIPCTHTSSFVCGLWTSMLSRVVLCRYASLVVCDFWAASTAACCYRNCYKICLLFTATVAATAAAKNLQRTHPMSVFCAGACPCAICQSQRLASSAMCLLRFPQLFSSGNEGDVEANPKFNSLALHSRSIFLLLLERLKLLMYFRYSIMEIGKSSVRKKNVV